MAIFRKLLRNRKGDIIIPVVDKLRWVPDYDNKTDLGGSTTSYTPTKSGWISFSTEAYHSGTGDPQIVFKMNNVEIMTLKGATTNNNGVRVIECANTFEVVEGDTFSYVETNVSGHNLRELYFIPGKWV